MNDYSIVFDVDSYKASHYLQYPPNTTKVFSYIESRGGRDPETVMFGLQYIIAKYLSTPVTLADVSKAKQFFAAHGLSFNEDGWRHVVQDHAGLLPIRIRAVPEGTVVPVGNALVTVENTCDRCFWATSWVETALMRLWYPVTVATESRQIKKLIMSYLEKTSDDPLAEISFKLHDFGSRGVSSQESAAIGGAAHLVNFMGSDTVVGIMAANEHYDCPMSAFSIPAAEHSTITSWGRENEAEAYKNMLRQFARPGALVAVVSDSYDIFKACDTIWGQQLKDDVVDSGAIVIVRPDSGHPTTVVRMCLEILSSRFGFTVNKKGYKVINNVRVIQGDGINRDSIEEILRNITEAGFSATNVAFGMGGALLQKHDRDTQKFAMKCSSITADGREIDVTKSPITDPGKRSKAGRLDLESFEGRFTTIKLSPGAESAPYSVMKIVYLDGQTMNRTTLEEVRRRAAI